ncbi:MAG: DbpA RNA binding domain-containing protein [Spirochaetaceae bacterium]|nr:DbpA RNA binding domain-containing protein [Spirochaetaceae bacterium]
MSRNEFSINAEQISSLLQETVNRIKSEEDPLEMNELKKIFKANVPLTMRTYVAAYFAKQLSGGYRGSYHRRDRNPRHMRYQDSNYSSRSSSVSGEGHTADSSAARTPVARAQIAEEFAQTVFVSVGRNRHVFARELVGLFSTVGGVARERIGDIRVCDNYSFVTLFAEDADSAIQKLDGIEYRGRKLSVSYSRRKESYAPVAADAQEGAVETEAVESAPIAETETTESAE